MTKQFTGKIFWGTKNISTSFHPRSLLNVIEDDTDRGSYLFLSNNRTNKQQKKENISIIFVEEILQ